MLPPAFHRLAIDFERSFGRDQRGSLFNDMAEPEHTDASEYLHDTAVPRLGDDDRLDTDVERALKARLSAKSEQWEEERFNARVKRLNEITEGGEKYKTCKISPGESNVIFMLHGDSDWRAGRIRDIFERVEVARTAFKTQSYLAIDEYIMKSEYRRQVYLRTWFFATWQKDCTHRLGCPLELSLAQLSTLVPQYQ